MTNRTDWRQLAIEILGARSEEVLGRLEAELHNAFVAGLESEYGEGACAARAGTGYEAAIEGCRRVILRALGDHKIPAREDDLPGDLVREALHHLERRVTELQAAGTRLENDRRMWKARAEAAREILQALAVDLPILQRLVGRGATEAEVRDLVTTALDVHERIELLERDAWTACSGIAREMVRAWDGNRLGAASSAHDSDLPPGWAEAIEGWVSRFREALR